MKKFRTLLVTALAAALPSIIHAGVFNVGNGYWMMSFDTQGTEPAWAKSKDSYGINQTTTHGFVAMMLGCHWGNCGNSGNHGLPKRISTIGGNVDTHFSQTSSSNKFDAAYDIWFDPTSDPTNRNSAHELMLWLQWKGTQPIASSYNAQGQAVPFARNVTLGGHTWNVYFRGGTFSFLLTSQASSITTQVRPFWQYAIARGWMGNNEFLNAVQAGWENVGGGKYTAFSFGVSGL